MSNLVNCPKCNTARIYYNSSKKLYKVECDCTGSFFTIDWQSNIEKAIEEWNFKKNNEYTKEL